MNLDAAKIDATSVQWDTSHALTYIETTMRYAVNFANDPQKKERLEKGECRYCFYVPNRIGGASCTFRPCGICGDQIGSGNTCIDKLCKGCGKKHELCRHCGADVNLRPRRVFKRS